ncbi:nucleotidyltransferase family protein [Halobacillus yeomjeoni]|uniref:nucleotidyltransferase family protein n=1 Tax=Halobacillus yeomjeoni TaxID=311194 RepID=UPI001F54E3AE|nr:nucleotidyltransferase family protein [Halobacillus yeomjeoni]
MIGIVLEISNDSLEADRGGVKIDQERRLIEIIHDKPYIQELFDTADTCFSEAYIGAGVITQTIWNTLHGYSPTYGIGDADLIYFDPSETVRDEKIKEEKVRNLLTDHPFPVDLTNQALVHHWYKEKFGLEISPYTSIEQAVGTWPTTASAIAVKREGENYHVIAPFGLNDLFDLVVRPNKRLVNEEIYIEKAMKWKSYWPELVIEPW